MRTATIVLPDGYDSAEAFAKDCGFELFTLQKRPVAWRVQLTNGRWLLYEDEETAYTVADGDHRPMQGLYARDGS